MRLPCSRRSNWDAALASIVQAVDVDLEHVRAHARLLEAARRWAAVAGDRGLLLRGSDLAAAEQWLAGAAWVREPTATNEQVRYIQASRQDATRRLRRLVAGVLVALVAVAVLGVVALLQRNVAVERERLATSRMLAARSVVLRETDPAAAVRAAAAGFHARRTAEAKIELRRAIAESLAVAEFGGPQDTLDDARMAPRARGRGDLVP